MTITTNQKRMAVCSGVLSPSRGARGEALVELVATIPFVFFLIVLVMNFSGLINAWITVANAARAAGDYAILSGSSAGLPTPATATSLQNLINADLGALPNLSSSNPHICIQLNNNNDTNHSYTKLLEIPSGECTTVNATATYGNPPTDGEAIASGSTTQYANVTVDIIYTYTPFFLGSRFMNYALPSIPTSVHQRAVMRVL